MLFAVMSPCREERAALCAMLKGIYPQSDTVALSDADGLVLYPELLRIDAAFIAVNADGAEGLLDRLGKVSPRLNTVLIADDSSLAAVAMAHHASGYIVRPVTESAVIKEVGDLRYGADRHGRRKFLKVKCFGNFEVCAVSGENLHFDRVLSKELFAYLVYKRGASCTTQEMSAILFGDKISDNNTKMYFQNIVSSMMRTLRKAGAEDVLERGYGYIHLWPERIACDWYDFVDGDNECLDNYNGEFMMQYSWAEGVNAYLDSHIWQRKALSASGDGE